MSEDRKSCFPGNNQEGRGGEMWGGRKVRWSMSSGHLDSNAEPYYCPLESNGGLRHVQGSMGSGGW